MKSGPASSHTQALHGWCGRVGREGGGARLVGELRMVRGGATPPIGVTTGPDDQNTGSHNVTRHGVGDWYRVAGDPVVGWVAQSGIDRTATARRVDCTANHHNQGRRVHAPCLASVGHAVR